jgi:hypothetical protein
MRLAADGKHEQQELSKWPKCGHPKTAQNTTTVAGRFEYCRTCENAKAMERYRRRQPNARRRYFATADEAVEHFITRQGKHWFWKGHIRKGGDAVIDFNYKTIYVARYLWKKLHGPIKPKHTLAKTCAYRNCVAPECRQERLRQVVCRSKENVGQFSRAAFESAIAAATRRDGTHLFAVDGKTTLQFWNRKLNLRNALWTRSGHTRDHRKPLIVICDFSQCLEPAHEREGVSAVLAMLRRKDGHLLVPAEMNAQTAKRIAWEAAEEPLPESKTLVTVCGRGECAEPAHQVSWVCNKIMPATVRSQFQRELRSQLMQKSPRKYYIRRGFRSRAHGRQA